MVTGRSRTGKRRRNRQKSTKYAGCEGDDTDDDTSLAAPQIGRIQVQMASIFVNVPLNDTMITYNSDQYQPPEHQAALEKVLNKGDDPTTSATLTEEAAVVRPPDGTVRPQHCWTRIYKELSKSYSKLRQYDAHYLAYALLDQAVDLLEPIVHGMRHEINRQDMILQANKYRSPMALERIHHLQLELEKVARKLKPFNRLLVHVIEDEAISAGATVYLRDVLDNLECHDEELRKLIADCQSIENQAEKYQSRQMSRTLYALTVLSAVFLPAQFLTGVFGKSECLLRWTHIFVFSFLHHPDRLSSCCCLNRNELCANARVSTDSLLSVRPSDALKTIF